MSPGFRLPARAWLLIPLCACGFLVWADGRRAARVDAVTNTDHEEAVVDAASPTGYAGGRRWLIVPEHSNRSYQWIAETQQMLARHEWRVRRVDYENAPFGREVHAASPAHWWLGLIAWCDHAASGRPLGLAVERAALWAEPLLHVLLLLGATWFVARQSGPFPAALLALGLAVSYPFAAGFLPGLPGDQGLARACALWSVLPLLAVFSGTLSPGIGRVRWMFLAAGVAGGLGLWISAASQAPIVVGVALGAALAAWVGSARAKKDAVEIREARPWRLWALAGASTSLGAYLIEYFPAQMDLRLEVNHPLFGLAWIGVGELLAQLEGWRNQERAFWRPRRAVVTALALAAVVALPVAMGSDGVRAFLGGDLASTRLTCLPNGVVAPDFSTWLFRDGFTAALGATCLPLLLLVPALWLLARRRAAAGVRIGIALALGPVLVALALASRQLAWWSTGDAMLLALGVAISAALRPTPGAEPRRWLWAGFAGLVLGPGLVLLVPPAVTNGSVEFTRLEVDALIERTLAHWMADHAVPGGAVVLLPPDRTTSWCFHGGFRGIGTANWENREGLAATVRIATATTPDEAEALIVQRGITHFVLPSWDTDLDEFARWTHRNPEDAFVMALHHWALPPWLRPLPYQLPAVAGFEGQSVAILEVTTESNRAVALGRLAEYFVEMQQLDLASATGKILQRYPADLGALVALAQVERAEGNAEGFGKTLNALVAGLSAGLDRTLAWDRRVSLAVVLALGERNDLAREQVRRCLEKLDEPRLRSLTTGSLYRLLALGKSFDQPVADPRLRALAARLLPAELRARL